MLTPKMSRLLEYISDTIGETGVCPTYKECAEALGVPGKSGIHRMVNHLEERGFVQRMPGKPRALRVLRMPRDAAAPKRGEGPGALAQGPIATGWDIQTSLPLYGTVSAGTPVSRISVLERYVEVPDSLVPRGQHFLLDLAGPSLEGIHIVHGERLVFQQGQKASEGAVVLAVVDRELAYVAERWSRGSRTLLQIPHPKHEDLLLEPERVEVRGILVASIRRF